MKQPDQILTAIARDHLFIETLKTRRSDRLDFHNVAVWAVSDALAAAFQAGHEQASCDLARLRDAAPLLLEALKDLLGDLPSVQGGVCRHCGREYEDIQSGDCPSDDCPSFHARAAIAKAKGGAA